LPFDFAGSNRLMAVTETFDPYRDWLDIDPRDLPSTGPDHYRLLGLARFESDAAKIAHVADARMAHVRSFQVGPRGRLTQKLLNELSAAKACLLSPPAKAAYDARLSQALAIAIQPPIAPTSIPPPVAEAVACPTDFLDGAVADSPAAWSRPVLAFVALVFVLLVGVLGWAVWRKQHGTNAGPIPAATVEQSPSASQTKTDTAEPTVQLQEGSGEVTLTAATARLTGGVELRHVGTTAVLGPWTAGGAAAHWRLRLIQPGFFQMEVHYSATREADGASLSIRSGTSQRAMSLRPSGGLDQFHSDVATIALPTGGQHDLVLTPSKPLGGDWLAIESVRLIPVGGATPPAILPEE
jgi:hypothetical protein